MSEMQKLYDYAKAIRKLALNMALSAGKQGCHIGGSFSCIEIFAVLYGKILNHNPKKIEENRDRFIASKSHCILAHFAALAEAGYLQEKDVYSFHDDGGLLAGHPMNQSLGLEFSGGSLGMGLSVGIGMALAARKKQLNYKTYVLLGDGECNEGSVWEACMSASQYNLDNLVAIVDYNNMQFDGSNDEIMSLAPLSDKFKAFGWKAIDVDGHSIESLTEALKQEHIEKPLAVIAHTVKAKGIPHLENKAECHHAALLQEDYDFVMREIEGGKYDRI